MYLLLYAGFLYLIIISVVLVARPYLMFNRYGNWKEFGIGRADPERYTWMPFWVFAIFSAIISYLVVLVLGSNNVLPGVIMEMAAVPVTVSCPVAPPAAPPAAAKSPKPGQDMAPGYYILDTSRRSGIPKYIYLGPEPPNLIYNTQ
jgi:hypothetical protein